MKLADVYFESAGWPAGFGKETKKGEVLGEILNSCVLRARLRQSLSVRCSV